MHEFSVTSQIVENILKEAERHKAKKVVQVNLAIGKLTFLGIEQVRFTYKLLVKGTIAEKSKLAIKEKDGEYWSELASERLQWFKKWFGTPESS